MSRTCCSRISYSCFLRSRASSAGVESSIVEQPQLASKVQAAVEYRVAVLAEFEKLVATEVGNQAV